MKVKDAMTGTAYYCQLDTNLGSATELMWVGNCGFLPVMGRMARLSAWSRIETFAWLSGRAIVFLGMLRSVK